MKRIVLVTRYPEAGRAKTRLIPVLGTKGAADIHRRLTENTVKILRELPSEIAVDIYFSGGSLQSMRRWLGEDLRYVRQPAGSLGKRLSLLAGEAFAGETDRLLFIGSDCPSLEINAILHAFATLETHQVILGPAADGGYYLIGLSSFFPQLFSDIPWGSERVLAATLAKCRQLALRFTLLPRRRDIDRPEDLPLLAWRI